MKVTVKVRYIGSASVPPSSVNLTCDSYLTCTGSAIAVDDYFGATPKVTPAQDTQYSCDTTVYSTVRLIHVNLDASGQGSFSYNVYLNVHGPATPNHDPVGGYYAANFKVDTRSFGIGIGSGPTDPNKRKAFTGATQQAYGTTAAGQSVAIGSPYPVAVPAPQLSPSGILNMHRELDYGLPLSKATDADGPDNSVHRDAPGPVGVTYIPIVSQNVQGNGQAEHYRWQESLDGITASADLPRTITIQYPAWTIENLTATYGLPLLVSEISFNAEKNRTYEPHDAVHSDTVNLHYEWNDGVSGDASVTTHLHQGPVDNWTPLGQLTENIQTDTFVTMFFDNGHNGAANWSDENEPTANLLIEPAGFNWIQAESTAAAGFALGDGFVALGLVTVPEATAVYLGMASAILGESTNFTPTPAPTPKIWSYAPNGQYDAAIEEANTHGRVTPSNYKDMMPLPVNGHYCPYVRWRVEGRPPTITNYYLGDKWGADGYQGQTVENRGKHKGTPLQGELRYWFDFPELAPATLPGGPGTGDPGDPPGLGPISSGGGQ